MTEDFTHLRAPTQKRSIERVNSILEAARGLIAKHGSAGLKIKDIAEAAGVTAGSMYQYFPNKAAIIQELGQRYLDETAGMIEAGLNPPPQNMDEVLAFVHRMFDAYYQMHRVDPVIQDIWMGTHADKTLQAIDDADTLRNAAAIYDGCARLFKADKEQEIKNAILLCLRYANTTLRVALSQGEEEAEMTVSLFKDMMTPFLIKFLK